MNEIVKKNGINFGLISGLIGVLVTTVMYAVDLKLFVNMWIGFVPDGFRYDAKHGTTI